MPKSERHSVVRVPDFKVNRLPSHGGSFLIFLLQWNPVNTVTNVTKKKMAVLTRFLLQESLWPFCRAAKKSGLNNEVTVLPRWPQGGVPLY